MLSYAARMTIDHGAPEPAYVQLANILRERITSGRIKGALPSNRTLQESFGLGEFAVTHALRVLAEEGLIYSVPRRGYYTGQPAS